MPQHDAQGSDSGSATFYQCSSKPNKGDRSPTVLIAAHSPRARSVVCSGRRISRISSALQVGAG
eukprot:4689840-Amphidinium_carterae.1